MINRTLRQVTAMVSGELQGLAGQAEETAVQGVSTDSRKIMQGNLYIPLIGDNFDGHSFAKECAAKGASAVMWQKDHGAPPEGVPIILVEDTLAALQSLAAAYRSELNVKVIGITGSNGKTTTKDMVAAMLNTTYKVHKTAGNLNNHIGLPLTLLQLAEDTEIAVLEMGMSGRGEIELLSRIAQPDAAMITNIGEAHLLQLGSREEIARAKAEILIGLKPGGFFAYYGEEPLIEMAVAELRDAGMLPAEVERSRFGAAKTNDVYPVAIMMDQDSSQFSLNITMKQAISMPLLGRHNIINAAGAAAVASHFGVTEERIRYALANIRLTGMRIEVVPTDRGVTFLNDAYNASPTSMRAALQLLTELQGYRRKIVVLGDMLELGPDEAELHAAIGRELDPEEISYVFTFGRLASHIADEAGRKYKTGHVLMFADKAALAETLKKVSEPGDVVLVKGSRGMKLEDVVYALKEAKNPNV